MRRTDDLLPHILHSVLRLLRGSVAALSSYDRHSHRYHLASVASRDRRWSAWRSLVCRVPPEFVAAPHVATVGVRVLPADDAHHPFARILAQTNSVAVYVALCHADEMIGMLHVVRPAVLTFDERDCRLARRIGDQMTRALLAARVA